MTVSFHNDLADIIFIFIFSLKKVNGSFACENDKTLNGILKTEFGFKGYVMSGMLSYMNLAKLLNGYIKTGLPHIRLRP